MIAQYYCLEVMATPRKTDNAFPCPCLLCSSGGIMSGVVTLLWQSSAVDTYASGTLGKCRLRYVLAPFNLHINTSLPLRFSNSKTCTPCLPAPCSDISARNSTHKREETHYLDIIAFKQTDVELANSRVSAAAEMVNG